MCLGKEGEQLEHLVLFVLKLDDKYGQLSDWNAMRWSDVFVAEGDENSSSNIVTHLVQLATSSLSSRPRRHSTRQFQSQDRLSSSRLRKIMHTNSCPPTHPKTLRKIDTVTKHSLQKKVPSPLVALIKPSSTVRSPSPSLSPS
jgi:hypothetical protein